MKTTHPHIRNDWICALTLCATAFYFVHRAWSGPHMPQGDTFQNLYFLLNQKLIAADHNPFQWGYASYMPFVGRWNPVLHSVFALVQWVVTDPMTQAFVAALLTSAVLLSAIAVSFFLLFRRLGLESLAGFAGALVATFSGFHLVGVYEFNHMYLLSYLGVPWIWRCCWEARRPEQRVQAAARAGLVIGLSLLGGSNAPLFFFLPFFGLLPFLAPRSQAGKFSERLRWFGALAVALPFGLAVAGGVLVPGLLFLGDTNRSQLGFLSGIASLTFKEKLNTLFLRDWWRMSGAHLHEADFYLGTAAVSLVGLGVWALWKKESARPFRSWIAFLSVCGVVGLLVTHTTWLPDFLARPIASFYSLLSIRHPNRFFSLLLVPLAFLAGLGFQSHTRREFAWAFSVAGATGLVLAYRMLGFQFARLLPDTRSALILVAVSTVLFGVSLGLGGRLARATALGFLYLSFAWAPLQSTHYGPDTVGVPSRLASLPESRLKWTSLLGLETHYQENLTRLRTELFEAPAPLAAIVGQAGGILDDADFGPGRRHYHAPQTKLHFPFTSIYDPASPRAIRELATLNHDPVWDMSGVCWRLRGNELKPRSQCFRPAYFVSGAVPVFSSAQELKWLAEQSTESLRHTASVSCTPPRCPNFSPTALASRKVTVQEFTPGKVNLAIEAGEPGLVVLTIPYRMDWRVTSSAGELTPFRANHAFLAVEVGPTQQSLVWELDPLVERIGDWISYTALFWLMGLGFIRMPKGLFSPKPTLLAEPK